MALIDGQGDYTGFSGATFSTRLRTLGFKVKVVRFEVLVKVGVYCLRFAVFPRGADGQGRWELRLRSFRFGGPDLGFRVSSGKHKLFAHILGYWNASCRLPPGWLAPGSLKQCKGQCLRFGHLS